VTKVIFEYDNGERREVDGEPGDSIMFTAMGAGVDGIIAECGGAAACGTCHVYVVSTPIPFPEPAPQEADMLEYAAADRRPESRLSCQLKLPDTEQAIIVRLPTHQL